MVSIQVGSTILEPNAHGGISIYAQNTCPKSDQYSHLHINTQNLPKPRSKMTKSQIRKYYFFENVKETLQIPLSFIERVVRV